MTEATDIMYRLLSREDQQNMVRNAIHQLEQKKFEAELNQVLVGDDAPLGPDGMTAPQKMALYDEQIKKLTLSYGHLLEGS